MPYYLTSYIGTGTYSDPFRPIGIDEPGAGSIDLRPDGSQLAGRAFLYLPVASSEAGLIQLAQDKLENLSPLIRNRIKNLLGTDFTETRFDQIVAKLLMIPPVGKWKPLRPSRVRQQWEIYLGDLFWTMPVLAGGTVITESFNKADSDILGPDLTWTELEGDIDVVTNQAQAITGTHPTARADSPLATDDHYAQVVWVGSANQRGSILRKDNTATMTYYRFFMSPTAMHIFKRVAGSFTQIGSTVTVTGVNGDVVKGQADGSTLKIFQNAVEKLSVTDTAIVNNLYTGFSFYGTADSIDSFEAGDLGAAGQPIRKRMGGIPGMQGDRGGGWRF